MVDSLNPFVVSGKIPPEYFCDRVEEAAQLEKSLRNQLNVVLTSARRMGKTSLVDFVFDKPEISENYITIVVDILHTTTFREFIMALGATVFENVATRSKKLRKQFVTLLKSVSASFGYDPILNVPTFDIRLGDLQNPEFTMGEIFSYLESVDKRCLVVIDANFVFSGSKRRLMDEMFFSSKRPFYQSAKNLPLEPIDKGVYLDFAMSNFKNANKNITEEAFSHVYDTFWGVTFYIQRIMKDAFAETKADDTCDLNLVKNLIEDYIDENDSRLREQLSYISESQKELLYAIHSEGQVQSITSAEFNKKHRLRSPSSTQSAALKLLEYDLITRKEKIYSLSDPLLKLWLDRKIV